MQKSSKIIIIVVSLIIIGGIIFFESTHYPEIEYTTIANTSIGTVEVVSEQWKSELPEMKTPPNALL